MGNIDFSNDSMFSWYCVMLAVTGLFTLVLASVTPRLSVWLRALVAVLGIASLSYAYYLVYVFHGGTYVVSFKIFFLPVFLVGGVLRALAMRRDAKLARRGARHRRTSGLLSAPGMPSDRNAPHRLRPHSRRVRQLRRRSRRRIDPNRSQSIWALQALRHLGVGRGTPRGSVTEAARAASSH